MSNYPAQIDNTQSLPTVVDNQTPVQASVFNKLRDAVIAVEATLGTQPNGLYATVAGRLGNLENIVGNLQIIEIQQDIGGTLESPLVVGLQGRPISDGAPLPGQALVWNGIAWLPGAAGGSTTFGGDIAGISGFQTVIGIQGVPIAVGTPTTGQVLEYNGTQWAAAAPPSGFTAGGDLTGTSTSQTVAKLQGHTLPAPSGTNTFLEWTGSALSWASGGGTLAGDVVGPSNSNEIARVQGSSAQLAQNYGSPVGTGNILSTQPNGMVVASTFLYETLDIFFDSSTNYAWVTNYSVDDDVSYTPHVTVIDTTTLQVVTRVSVPHVFSQNFASIRRVKGDPSSNYIYGTTANSNSSNLVAIIDKTQFKTVGYLSVTSPVTIVTGQNGLETINALPGDALNVVSTTGFPSSGSFFIVTTNGRQSVSYTSTTPTSFVGLSGGIGNIFPQSQVFANRGLARDVAPDLAGNVWVTDNFNNTVSKFLASDITAAIANYPIPQPPSGPVVALTPDAESCTWDAANSFLWVGSSRGTTPYTLSKISSAGSIVAQNNTYTTTGMLGYHGLIAYQGFIWASTGQSTVLKINPSTFPLAGAYTPITTTALRNGDLYIDTFNQTILVQDQQFGNNLTNQPVAVRINAPAGTVASTIQLPYAQVSASSNGASLPTGTINVNSTTGFPPSGVIYVASTAGVQAVTYAAIGPTTFTGCTGGTGTINTNNNVSIGTTGNGHGWITPVAVSASTMLIGDNDSNTGMFVYSNTPGSETFQQFYQPTVLEYGGIVWENNGTILGSQTSTFPFLYNPPPIRYFNVSGSGYTFSEGVDSSGNLVANLNLTGGGISGITVENQSSSLGTTFTSLNFTGAGVTASGSVPNATITIPGFTAGGDLTGTVTSQTVVAIRGNPVSATAPTAGQFLIENSAASGSAWTSISGTDVSASVVTPGLLKVTGIQGNAVPVPSGTNTNLQWSGSAFSWASGGGGGLTMHTQTFTSSGTFTAPSTIGPIAFVTGWGGGGGGGGGMGGGWEFTHNIWAGGGGGGAGAIPMTFPVPMTGGVVYSVVIGAGGTGGAGGAANTTGSNTGGQNGTATGYNGTEGNVGGTSYFGNGSQAVAFGGGSGGQGGICGNSGSTPLPQIAGGGLPFYRGGSGDQNIYCINGADPNTQLGFTYYTTAHAGGSGGVAGTNGTPAAVITNGMTANSSADGFPGADGIATWGTINIWPGGAAGISGSISGGYAGSGGGGGGAGPGYAGGSGGSGGQGGNSSTPGGTGGTPAFAANSGAGGGGGGGGGSGGAVTVTGQIGGTGGNGGSGQIILVYWS